MTSDNVNHVAMSDHELLLEVPRLVRREGEATARLIAALGELDARRLYLAAGFPSLFVYCTQALHLSEHAAYARIEAARAARKWPIVLQLLAEGSLHLTAITLLSRHLSTENHQQLLAAARHKSKREVEEIIAALRPQPPVPATVRKLPVAAAPARPTDLLVDSEVAAVAPTSGIDPRHSVPLPAALRAEVKPLAPELYKVQFTASRETCDKLRQAQDLLRHRIPNGDIAIIVDRALTLLLTELQRTKYGTVQRPRPDNVRTTRGRHVPAAVKRAVCDRDGGQCAFVGVGGRCPERGFLEFHHLVPFADGGATVASNLELRCRAHNAYEAERWFGVREEDMVREERGPFDVQPVSCSWQPVSHLTPGAVATSTSRQAYTLRSTGESVPRKRRPGRVPRVGPTAFGMPLVLDPRRRPPIAAMGLAIALLDRSGLAVR